MATSTPLGNRDLIRAINRSIILNAIKSSGAISRADIARLTGLSPATVTGIAGELIADNLVFEKASGDSSGGRPPILLSINPRGGYVIGIKLAETQAIGALTDLNATIIARRTLPLLDHGLDDVIDRLAILVRSLLKDGGVRKKQLLGVGLGLAGVVDSASGVLRLSPFFGWRNVPIRNLLQSSLHVPVYVDNDVNTLTLSEKLFGAGQNANNFLTVTLGRGVGMGIVVHGELYRGKGGAGEFGHTVVNPDGPLCDCGHRGCLETYVSDAGLMRAAVEMQAQGELPGSIESLEQLIAAAQEGNAAARSIFERAGRLLGIQIAGLINLYDPDLIVISGEGVRSGEWLLGPLCAEVDNHVIPGIAGDTEIRVDPWGDDAWARGAASLVLGELFKSPVHQESRAVSSANAANL